MPRNDRYRYDQSNRTFGKVAVFLIGLGMTLGSLALFVGLVLDIRAFPDTPEPMDFSTAVGIAAPPRGTWITVTNAVVDCAKAPARSKSNAAWVVLRQAGSSAPILVHLGDVPAPSCDDVAAPFTGVLSTRAPADLPRLPWDDLSLNTPVVTLLWANRTPPNPWDLLVIPILLVPGLAIVVGALMGFRDASSPLTTTRAAPLSHVGIALPLSTGASAIHLFTTPMMVFHVVAFGPLFFATRLPGWTVVPVGVMVALWFFAVVGLLLKAWIQRASDLRMGHQGVEIHGGPMHGTRHDWTDLVEGSAKWQLTEGPSPLSTLWIGGEVVAESDHPQ